MAKKAYIGVSGVARKVKKAYIGVGGVARKIKKMYIGIGGIARQFFSSGELAYYGTATALSLARTNLAGASVGNYALFAGGRDRSNYYIDIVDAYNTSLTRSTPTALSVGRQGLAGASVGNYALFAGGACYDIYYGGSTESDAVDAYNTSLTRSTPSVLSLNRVSLAGASVGNYALFAGGSRGDYNAEKKTVDAYDTSLTRSTPSVLSSTAGAPAGASVGNYALFASCTGPTDSSTSYSGLHDVVTAYDASLTRSTPTALSLARSGLAGASVGNYALFAGGKSDSHRDIVDAYNTSLTRSTITALSLARTSLAGASVGNYALFAGGWTGTSSIYAKSVVDVYDISLTRSIQTELSATRYSLKGATVGNYALFAGGNTNSSTYCSTTDAYTVS